MYIIVHPRPVLSSTEARFCAAADKTCKQKARPKARPCILFLCRIEMLQTLRVIPSDEEIYDPKLMGMRKMARRLRFCVNLLSPLFTCARWRTFRDAAKLSTSVPSRTISTLLVSPGRRSKKLSEKGAVVVPVYSRTKRA